MKKDESIMCQHLPGNFNFSIYNANYQNDNDESGREKELNEDKPFIVNYPSRMKIRGDVGSNLAKNQGFMAKKYEKK